MAEKYQTLVNLGIANSRMKEFYDLWIMAHQFNFDGLTLSEAIRNTFARRQTPVPTQTPSGLDSAFYSDKQKNLQWNAFLRKGMLLSSSTPHRLRKYATCWKHSFCRQPKLWKITKPSSNDGSPVARGNPEWCWSDRLSYWQTQCGLSPWYRIRVSHSLLMHLFSRSAETRNLPCTDPCARVFCWAGKAYFRP